MASGKAVVLAALVANGAIAILKFIGFLLTGSSSMLSETYFLIGIILMVFAVALAWENKRLLLGESLPEDREKELESIVESFDSVVDVQSFSSAFFGPEQALVTIKADFVDEDSVGNLEETLSEISKRLKEEDEVFRVYIEPNE